MKLIDKAAVVAEIERRVTFFLKESKKKTTSNDSSCAVALHGLLSFLDTIEVKEVDLEKESLTWEDIRELYIIFAEIDAEIEFCKTDIQAETIGYYQEVLKRFISKKGE